MPSTITHDPPGAEARSNGNAPPANYLLRASFWLGRGAPAHDQGDSPTPTPKNHQNEIFCKWCITMTSNSPQAQARTTGNARPANCLIQAFCMFCLSFFVFSNGRNRHFPRLAESQPMSCLNDSNHHVHLCGLGAPRPRSKSHPITTPKNSTHTQMHKHYHGT